MSFTQGLSGLNAASKGLEVVGNNVANASTVGFKGSVAQFADVFAASLGGAGVSNIGIGAKLATVAQQFTQGNISVTNNTLDMAVNGPGFFVTSGVDGIGYTRNGQFQVDKNGNIVTSSGQFLQGWPAAGGIVATSGAVQNLVISTASITPTQTANMNVGLNLDSRMTPPSTLASPVAFDPDVSTSYNSSTSTTIYDSKGNPQIASLYFVKAPLVPASTSTGPTSSTTVGTTTVTVANTAGLVAGQPITETPPTPAGSLFPAGTVIQSITNGTTIVVSQPALATSAVADLTFGVPNPVTAGATAGSTTVTVASTLGFAVGQAVTGLEVPAGTTIAAIDSTTNTITLSQAATATNAASALSFAPLTGNSWNVYARVVDATQTPSVVLSPNPVPTAPTPWTAIGSLVFNTNGTYNAAGSTIPVIPSYTPAGSSTMSVTLDFSTATQFGASFGVTALSQDGNTSGNLSGFSVAKDGTITGRYSNGMNQALGLVALATFPNNQGLQPLGENRWAASNASGAAVVGQPGTGINGVIQTASLEDSNVDLTAELVNMITAQRVYQANAQTIKTQDALMQTLVNLR